MEGNILSFTTLAFNHLGSEYEKWQVSPDLNLSGKPAIDENGNTYVLSYTEDDALSWGSESTLYAYMPDGTLKWTYTGMSGTGHTPSIGPDNTIYVGTNVGRLYAINPDGTNKWTFYTIRLVADEWEGDNLDISKTIAVDTDSNVIIAGNSNLNHKYSDPVVHQSYLAKINADGTIGWTATFDNKQFASKLTVDTDGDIYIADSNRNLYSYNSTGGLNWNCDTNPYSTTGTLNSAPIITYDTIYIASTNGRLYAVTKDGTVKWSYNTGRPVNNSPVVCRPDTTPDSMGTIYVTNSAGVVSAIRSDGDLRWQFSMGDSSEYGPVVGSSGTVYTGNREGHLFSINPDGTHNWIYPTGTNIKCSPVIATNGAIYFIGQNSNSNDILYAIDSSETGLQHSDWPAGGHDTKNTNYKSTAFAVPNQAPVIKPIADQEINIDNNLSFLIEATDQEGDAVICSASNLPAGATFNANTNTFSWTPQSEDIGSYTVTFTATDSNENSSSIDVNINVVDEIPYFEPVSKKVVYLNQTIDFQVTAHDPDGLDENLTYWAEGLPAGATFDATSRRFNWTPTVDDIGIYNVHFYVSDGEHTNSIQVKVGNIPPIYTKEETVAIGGQINSITEDNNTLHIGNDDGTVYRYNGADISTISTTCNSIKDTYYSDGYTYVACGNDNIYVYDNGLAKSITDINSTVYNISADWHYLYVSTDSGVLIYDATSNFSLVKTLNSSGSTYVASDYDYVYVANSDGKIDVYDIYNNFNFKTNLFLSYPPSDMYSDNENLYVVTGDELRVFDSNQSYIQYKQLNANGSLIFSDTSHVYVVGEKDIVSILDKTSLDKIGEINELTSIGAIYSDSSKLYIGTSDLYVYDIALFGHHDLEVVSFTDKNGTHPYSTYQPQALEARQFYFTPNVINLDGGPLSYLPVSIPDNAAIDNTTGKFAWTPDSTQVGSTDIVYRVSGGTQLSATINVTVDVLDTADMSSTYVFVTPEWKAVSPDQDFTTNRHLVLSDINTFITDKEKSTSTVYQLITNADTDISDIAEFRTTKHLDISVPYSLTTTKEKILSTVSEFTTDKDRDNSSILEFMTDKHLVRSAEKDFKTTSLVVKSSILPFSTLLYKAVSKEEIFKTSLITVKSATYEFKTPDNRAFDYGKFITPKHIDRSISEFFATDQDISVSSSVEFATTIIKDISSPLYFKTKLPVAVSDESTFITNVVYMSFFKTPKWKVLSGEKRFITKPEINPSDIAEFRTRKEK